MNPLSTRRVGFIVFNLWPCNFICNDYPFSTGWVADATDK